MQTDVGEFIAARSDRLLRTAYLLTGDRARAEELLQDSLSRVWATWSRSELSPDLAARRELVRGMPPQWRRRTGEPSDEVLAALDRLPRRQRAALVLTEVDRLTERELAEVLECSPPIAARLLARARAAFAGRDPAVLLASVEVAGGPSDVEVPTLAQRLAHVERRVGSRRRWRRVELVASLVVATVAAIAAGVLLSSGSRDTDQTTPQPNRPSQQAPPVIVGHQLPPILHVDGVNYQYAYNAVSRPAGARVEIVLGPRENSQAVTWVTPWTLRGDVVVEVDGLRVYRGGPGPLGEGARLSSGHSHVVVLRALHPAPGTQLGLAVYHWPRG
jgi:DNA-directed RNA polymerase specialized sigma24 family protein